MSPSFIDILASYWTPQAMSASIAVSTNLILALFLGLIVGYERAYRGRAAGMRTYGLVCMASAALTAVSGYSSLWFGGQIIDIGPIDPTRIVQGIVTGIGFLGAGIIMKDGMSISGLTTAASIWAASAIGVLIGLGFHTAAISLALISTVIMMIGAQLESWLPSKQAVSFTVRFKAGSFPCESDVCKIISAHGYEMAKGSISITSKDKHVEWHFVAISTNGKKGSPLSHMSQTLLNLPDIEDFQLSLARN